MDFKEVYGTSVPLIKDSKGRIYLPEKIFCDVLGSDMILVNTPAVGVIIYKINKNKDGSMWIKGDKISKYYPRDKNDSIPRRLFLTNKIIEKLNEE
jgi:hypothetical protein